MRARRQSGGLGQAVTLRALVRLVLAIVSLLVVGAFSPIARSQVYPVDVLTQVASLVRSDKVTVDVASIATCVASMVESELDEGEGHDGREDRDFGAPWWPERPAPGRTSHLPRSATLALPWPAPFTVSLAGTRRARGAPRGPPRA